MYIYIEWIWLSFCLMIGTYACNFSTVFGFFMKKIKVEEVEVWRRQRQPLIKQKLLIFDLGVISI